MIAALRPKTLLLIALLLALLGPAAIYLLRPTDEERVRGMLHDMADGFSDAHPADATDGFADEVNYNREQLQHQALIGYLFGFFRRAGLHEGKPRYFVEIIDEETTIAIDESANPPAAGVTVAARFHDRASESDPSAASGDEKPGTEQGSAQGSDEQNIVRAELSLVKLDNGWRIIEITKVTGKPPFRY